MDQPSEPGRELSRPLLVGAVVAIGFALAIVGLLLVVDPSLSEPSVATEVYKAVIQLALIGIVGGILTLAFEEVQHRRERRERAVELERERRRQDFDIKMALFREIVEAYNEVKSARRAVNGAKGDGSLSDVDPVLIAQQLARLNHAQLSFESIMRVMRVRKAAFEEQAYMQLERDVRQMEAYVGKVIKSATGLEHDKFKAFEAFLGSRDEAGGLSAGWQPYELKEERTEGHGPSAIVWDVERVIGQALQETRL